jgi:hypothetical protein
MSYFNYVLRNVDNKEIIANGELARIAKEAVGLFLDYMAVLECRNPTENVSQNGWHSCRHVK